MEKGIWGLKVSQARRLKELERENSRSKKAVAELTLDKVILKEAQVFIEQWRTEYKTFRPHSSLGYTPAGCGSLLQNFHCPEYAGGDIM